jgi:polygalacturonase
MHHLLLRLSIAIGLWSVTAVPAASAVYDVTDFGAKGDGSTVNTDAIQKAIDQCSQAGGGRVLIAGGNFVTGTLFFKSHVELHVAPGATLLGSKDISDYAENTHKNMYKNEPHMDRCLIFAREAQGISVTGSGTIDGQGHRENFPNKGTKHRPMMIRLLNCRNIRMRDVTLQHPAAWTSAWLCCEDIVVDGITIHSRANGNGDGLDFDGCQKVRVSNCAFDTSDDSICLQASLPDRPCRDVVISNCVFCSKWAGIRIGLLSRGDIENVAMSNCIFKDIQDSGLKIQMCEGGVMQNMTFSNLMMTNVPRPIFATFCQQRACCDAPEDIAPMKAMRRMLFDNILVDNRMCDRNSAIVLTGMPGHAIEDIRLSNIQLQTGGGGTVEEGARRTLPEYTLETLDGWWPEYHLLDGAVPCHGVYARHMAGLTLDGIQIKTARADGRPAIVCDDVCDLELRGLRLQGQCEAESMMRLQRVTRGLVHNYHVTGECQNLVHDEDSAHLRVTNNYVD